LGGGGWGERVLGKRVAARSANRTDMRIGEIYCMGLREAG
jgi:hypothetical protein